MIWSIYAALTVALPLIGLAVIAMMIMGAIITLSQLVWAIIKRSTSY